MIVRPAPDHLLLVTQPDHAALAARIMEGWQRDGLPSHELRDRLLLATREHDNGWHEPDSAPLTDPATGAPCDFMTAPDRVRQAVWLRAVMRLGPEDPLVGALVAHHALTVQAHRRDEAGWPVVFAWLRAARARLLGLAPGAPPDEAFLAAYRVVALGDLLSLVFCNAWTDVYERAGYQIILRGNALVVRPDPFSGRQLPLRVPARRLPRRRYASHADLRAALARAEVEWISGTATGK